MISKEDFKKYFLGYNSIDCEVRNKDIFYFVVREDYTQWNSWKEGRKELNVKI